MAATSWMASGHPILPTETLALEALMRPVREVDVGVPVHGTLDRVLVEMGDPVEAGQLLAELDSRVERASERLAAARAAAQADVSRAERELAIAERRLEQNRGLHERGIVSAEDFAKFEDEVELARFDLASAREEREEARLEHELAKARLEQRRIVAPSAGVVVAKWLEAGELAGQSDSEVLVRLAQLDPLVVELHAPMQLFGQLELGETLMVTPLLPRSPARRATIVALEPVIDTASETFRVRLELPNPGRQLPAGLRCTVAIPTH